MLLAAPTSRRPLFPMRTKTRHPHSPAPVAREPLRRRRTTRVSRRKRRASQRRSTSPNRCRRLTIHRAQPASGNLPPVPATNRPLRARPPQSAARRTRLDDRHIAQASVPPAADSKRHSRSEEHTSELQSRLHLVCRLLLEKKKKKQTQHKQ